MISLALALALQATTPASVPEPTYDENRAYAYYVAGACSNYVFTREEAVFWQNKLKAVKPVDQNEAAQFDIAFQQGERSNIRLDMTQCRRALIEAFEALRR